GSGTPVAPTIPPVPSRAGDDQPHRGGTAPTATPLIVAYASSFSPAGAYFSSSAGERTLSRVARRSDEVNDRSSAARAKSRGASTACSLGRFRMLKVSSTAPR